MDKTLKYPMYPDDQPYYPFDIQLTVVQGCNRRCYFCGLQGVPKNMYKPSSNHMMSLDTVQLTFEQLAEWLPKIRVELNLHGEPSLHPQLFEIVSLIRSTMPSAGINLSTNTEIWWDNAEEWMREYFGSGGNSLILNCYKNNRYEEAISKLESLGWDFIDFYHDNPRHIAHYSYCPPNKTRIFVMDDLGSVSNSVDRMPLSKRLHNSGGNGRADIIAKNTGQKVRTLPLASKCSKVFRELNMRWDGEIIPCCADWNFVHPMGNVHDLHIHDIWFSDKWWAMRELLMRRRRDLLAPCRTCDDATIRVGLIKYPTMLDYTDDELVQFIKECEK